MTKKMSSGLMVVVAASLLLAVSMSLHGASAAYCTGAPKADAKPNMNDIFIPDTNSPSGTLVSSNENGAVYRVGEGDDAINVLHLFGDDAYTMGQTQGSFIRCF